MDIMTWLDKQKNWWKTFFLVFVFIVSVVGYIEVLRGYRTYEYAPARADFADEIGTLIFSGEEIAEGQQVSFHDNLMDYGSFLGDGATRGPDFTAEALNLTAHYMTEYTEPPIVRGSRK